MLLDAMKDGILGLFFEIIDVVTMLVCRPRIKPRRTGLDAATPELGHNTIVLGELVLLLLSIFHFGTPSRGAGSNAGRLVAFRIRLFIPICGACLAPPSVALQTGRDAP